VRYRSKRDDEWLSERQRSGLEHVRLVSVYLVYLNRKSRHGESIRIIAGEHLLTYAQIVTRRRPSSFARARASSLVYLYPHYSYIYVSINLTGYPSDFFGKFSFWVASYFDSESNSGISELGDNREAPFSTPSFTKLDELIPFIEFESVMDKQSF